MKQLLFDTQAFQYLILQPKYQGQFQRCKQLVGNGDIIIFGNISFLEELIGLSSKNSVNYKKVLKEYRIITNQKLLKPCNNLIQMEIDNRAPLKQADAFFSDEKSNDIYDALEKEFILETLDESIHINKQNNLLRMITAKVSAQNKLFNSNKSQREIKVEAKKWLKNFDANIQSWGNAIFNPSGEIDFTALPHVASFISYLLKILYQTTMSKQKHKDSDEYDRKYIVEAAAIDVFITEDKALTAMYNQLPNKYQFVKVQQIDNVFA